MKVTLAVDYDGKKADSTIELEDSVAKRLLEQGRAREAESRGKPKVDPVAEAVRAKSEEAASVAYVAADTASVETPQGAPAGDTTNTPVGGTTAKGTNA